jgi:hypothetical protein
VSYRILASRAIVAWALVALLSRLPVAMAPLAMVFLARAREEGYALGGILAGAYIAGEVVGALTLGAMLRAEKMRGQIGAGLAVAAIAFACMGFYPSAPPALLLVLSFVAGAAPAASPGAMRTLLTRMVPESDVARALSAEAILTEIIWMAAPAIVVLAALQAGRGVPLAMAAGCLAVAALGVLTLISGTATERDDDARTSGATKVRVLAAAWPVYVTSAAALSLVAAAELALPALLEHRNLSVGLAGVMLSAFAIVSAAGAYVYGLRAWPGAVRTQSTVCLFATAAGITLTAVMPGLAGIAIGIVAAGVFQSVVMVSRNLSLRERLPADLHAFGYSIMYAVQGVGYSLSAVLIAFSLARFTPPVAILAGVAFTVVLAAVAAASELRGAPQPMVIEGEQGTAP